MVTSIQGPSGSEPAAFGEVTSWTIAADSATEPAQEFVEYMMTDGYEPWIAIAPEGKIPVRAGSAPATTELLRRLGRVDVGVDTKAPLSDFYGPDVLDALTTGPDPLHAGRSPRARVTCSARSRASSPWPRRSTRCPAGHPPRRPPSRPRTP